MEGVWTNGHRKQQGSDGQPEASELYDEVTDDQYRSIVGARLNQDDFIIDDDGSGYVDNGEDDWDNRDDDEESEHEDFFEGEDEELTKGKLGGLLTTRP